MGKGQCKKEKATTGLNGDDKEREEGLEEQAV